MELQGRLHGFKGESVNDDKTLAEIKTIDGLVRRLLQVDERCRNDDKWLTFRVMRHFTNIYIPFEDFKKIPAFETVKRCRAKIQNNEGLYPPTDAKALARRQQRERVFSNYAVSE